MRYRSSLHKVRLRFPSAACEGRSALRLDSAGNYYLREKKIGELKGCVIKWPSAGLFYEKMDFAGLYGFKGVPKILHLEPRRLLGCDIRRLNSLHYVPQAPVPLYIARHGIVELMSGCECQLRGIRHLKIKK